MLSLITTIRRYLPACLRALATQSVPADEIIVVDDASTDNSLEVLQGLARQYPLVKVYRNPVNLNVAGAVSRGIDLASGQFVYLASADDEVMPGFFKRTLPLLARHPEAGLCAGICRMIDMDGNLSYEFGRNITGVPCFLSPQQVVQLVRQDRFLVFGTAVLWRRDAMLRAGKYHAALRWHSDWFPMFALAFRHGLCFVPEVLAEFRSRPSGLSNSGMKNLKIQLESCAPLWTCSTALKTRTSPRFSASSGALASFGKEMLWLVLAHRRYWKNINPNLSPPVPLVDPPHRSEKNSAPLRRPPLLPDVGRQRRIANPLDAPL